MKYINAWLITALILLIIGALAKTYIAGSDAIVVVLNMFGWAAAIIGLIVLVIEIVRGALGR